MTADCQHVLKDGPCGKPLVEGTNKCSSGTKSHEKSNEKVFGKSKVVLPDKKSEATSSSEVNAKSTPSSAGPPVQQGKQATEVKPQSADSAASGAASSATAVSGQTVSQVGNQLGNLTLGRPLDWQEYLNVSRQNNVNSESLMKEVDETFCSNDKQIIKQTGSELKDTFQRAKDRFGTPIKVLPATVGEKKTTLLDFRAQVKCQIAECFGRLVVQISWQPQSSKELLQFVNMVCKEVYDKDLQRRPNTERRGQEAVKGRLDSMGVGTKLEGCLREEYPHYRTLYGDVVHNTRNSKRYDLLASFGDFQVLVEFKKIKDFTSGHYDQLKDYLGALREDNLKLTHGLLVAFPTERPMHNSTAIWNDDMGKYSIFGHDDYVLDSVKEHIADNYRIFTKHRFCANVKHV